MKEVNKYDNTHEQLSKRSNLHYQYITFLMNIVIDNSFVVCK